MKEVISGKKNDKKNHSSSLTNKDLNERIEKDD